jgi:hypothetical protein
MSTSNSSKNALSHGAYSSQAVLPWENEQEFKDLHEELREDFFPNGRAEEETVFDLACLNWKKRRLNIGSQLAFRRDRDVSALTEAGRLNGWEGIAEHFAKTLDNNESARETMRSINKDLREMVAPVHGLVFKRIQQMLAPDGTNQDSKQNAAAELEKLTVLMNEMKAAAGVVGAALRVIESNCLDEKPCERAYRPDLMERDLKILADIDKQIDKTIVRLAQLKEYKRIYVTKEVKARPAEVTSLPAKHPN